MMKKKLFTLLFALVATITVQAQEDTIDGHEYVDLGLPSGTLWASCNVGATKPEEYGDYFAWGETKGYSSDTSDGHSFDWANYKWCNGSYNSLTKYNYSSGNGTIDNKMELDLEDDAAYGNWGSNWRMPSREQQDELRQQCNWTWTTLNGVNGYRVTSKTNGNSIFLPAAGWRYGTSPDYAGSYGSYWSRSLDTYSPDYAYYLYFYSLSVDWANNTRDDGRSVRPVVAEDAITDGIGVVSRETITITVRTGIRSTARS
ncbi:MAG: hypothetical protein IJ605_06785 [Prevotella sp.]|nr:hypothetical protein [Prevotella sp.]